MNQKDYLICSLCINIAFLLFLYWSKRTINDLNETLITREQELKLFQEELSKWKCEFSLCRGHGYGYCFTIKTDCSILERKCSDTEYLNQWNLNCTMVKDAYNNCECWFK